MPKETKRRWCAECEKTTDQEVTSTEKGEGMDPRFEMPLSAKCSKCRITWSLTD